jgi:hypothetical protein
MVARMQAAVMVVVQVLTTQQVLTIVVEGQTAFLLATLSYLQRSLEALEALEVYQVVEVVWKSRKEILVVVLQIVGPKEEVALKAAQVWHVRCLCDSHLYL